MTLQELQEYLNKLVESNDEEYYYCTVDNLVNVIKDLSIKVNKLSPLNDLAKEQYEWIENTVPHWHNKTVLECLALIASEVGEAVNEARDKELTDNFKYELVDILFRVFDLAHQHNIDLDNTVKDKMLVNKNRDFSKKLK